MIPTGQSILDKPVQIVKQPSYTWKIDFERGRISGTIDNLEAVKQSVYKIMATPRYHHLIYSFNYGSEVTPLVGKSAGYVQSEINRRIKEALSQDDRITSIDDIKSTINGDSILTTFTVTTDHGSFEFSQEARL